MKNPFAAAAAFAERLSDPNAASRPARSAEPESGKSAARRVPSLRPGASSRVKGAPSASVQAESAQAVPVPMENVPIYEVQEAVPTAEPVYEPTPAPAAPRVTNEYWGGMRVQTIELPTSAFVRQSVIEEAQEPTPVYGGSASLSGNAPSAPVYGGSASVYGAAPTSAGGAKSVFSPVSAAETRPGGMQVQSFEIPASFFAGSETPAQTPLRPAASAADTDGIIPDSETDELSPAFIRAATPPEENVEEEESFPSDASDETPAESDETAEGESPAPPKKKKIRVNVDVDEMGSTLWALSIFLGLLGTAVAFIAACFA